MPFNIPPLIGSIGPGIPLRMLNTSMLPASHFSPHPLLDRTVPHNLVNPLTGFSRKLCGEPPAACYSNDFEAKNGLLSTRKHSISWNIANIAFKHRNVSASFPAVAEGFWR